MTPPIKLIGLVGHKQSGKDSVYGCISKFDASYLTKCKCLRFAFADKLKAEVAELLGTTVEKLEAQKSHPLVRHIFQWYGVFKREQDINYWIKQLDIAIESYKKLTVQCVNVFVTDVRFRNEADYIKSNGGLLWRIRNQAADSVWDTHASEMEIEMIECDNFIHNDSSMLRLEMEVKDVMRQHQLLK